jgi:hypothetical protein
MSDLPSAPPPGTPVVTRKVYQPQDESPDVYIKDGKLVSKNPTAPKQRAEFEVQKITQTFNYRPLFEALDEFFVKNDLDGFIKCWENCVLDIKTIDRHVIVTINPGG